MKNFITNYRSILDTIANISIVTLELIGILIIIIGALSSIVLCSSNLFKNKIHHNIKIDLAKCLALGLEFKMGAEIIKTVLIHDLNELAILAFIIVLRAGLAFLIHWEINVERKEEIEKENKKNKS